MDKVGSEFREQPTHTEQLKGVASETDNDSPALTNRTDSFENLSPRGTNSPRPPPISLESMEAIKQLPTVFEQLGKHITLDEETKQALHKTALDNPTRFKIIEDLAKNPTDWENHQTKLIKSIGDEASPEAQALTRISTQFATKHITSPTGSLSHRAQTYQKLHAEGHAYEQTGSENQVGIQKTAQGSYSPEETKNPYADALSNAGYVTPFTDAYGLARTTAETLFGAKPGMSEAQIAKLPKFRNPPPELKAIRDSMKKVFAANKKTLYHVQQHPQSIQRNLEGNGRRAFQYGMEELNTRFPAFNNFLNLMASYNG